MMLLEAVTVLALSPDVSSLTLIPYFCETSVTTGWDTRTSLNVETYCDAALWETPFPLMAGTTTLALAWYAEGCLSMRNPVINAATIGRAMTSHRMRRIALR